MHSFEKDDLIEKYKQYPQLVKDAIYAVVSYSWIHRKISDANLRVLCALLRRIEVRKKVESVSVTAALGELAEEADTHEKTVRRSIATFRELGWLSMDFHAQPRVTTGKRQGEKGAWKAKTYDFTPMFCELVSLPYPGVENDLAAEQEETLRIKMEIADAVKRELQKARKEKQRDEPINLTEELRAACNEFNIKESHMAFLRGFALSTKDGKPAHNVADVIECARAYLLAGEIKGQCAVNYIKAMCEKISDYAGRAKQLRKDGGQVIRSSKKKEERPIVTYCRHKTFYGANGLVVKVYENVAEVTDNGKTKQVPEAEFGVLYEAVENGKLRVTDEHEPYKSAVTVAPETNETTNGTPVAESATPVASTKALQPACPTIDKDGASKLGQSDPLTLQLTKQCIEEYGLSKPKDALNNLLGAVGSRRRATRDQQSARIPDMNVQPHIGLPFSLL